jgi:hypothetical protein
VSEGAAHPDSKPHSSPTKQLHRIAAPGLLEEKLVQRTETTLSLDFGSNTTTRRLWQFLKQSSETVSTDEGIQTEASDEQPENANLPKIRSAEGHWKAKSESAWQLTKQWSGIVATDDGRQIGRSEEQPQKAPPPSFANREPGST